MPASLYESLVKEYLETEGYLVYNNLRIPISGEMQNGNNKWKEIDIFAYSPVKGAIIGESKAKPLNEKGIKDEASKLDREAIGPYITEIYGVDDFKLVLYCWNLYEHDKDIRNKAKDLGFDYIITFPQIVKALLENVKKSRGKNSWFYDINRPNTILLQIIYDALDPRTEYLSLKDFVE